VSNILNRYYAVVTAMTRLKFDRRAISVRGMGVERKSHGGCSRVADVTAALADMSRRRLFATKTELRGLSSLLLTV